MPSQGVIGPHTHVCGILAGSGEASRGVYRGIAPECSLICGKVLDERGAGSLRNLLDGLQWIMHLMNEYPIRIINISIEMEQGADLNPLELSVLMQFLDFFWKSDVLVIAAAGNKGPEPMSISPISESGGCICVGCHDGDYVGVGGRTCAEYSARGPSRTPQGNIGEGNPLKKPDIVAPGTDIVSCNNRIFWRNRAWHRAYIAKSGTSMATPVVSGACALYLQKYPKVTNVQLRRNLLSATRDMKENWSVQGAGMLQIDKFLEKTFL